MDFGLTILTLIIQSWAIIRPLARVMEGVVARCLLNRRDSRVLRKTCRRGRELAREFHPLLNHESVHLEFQCRRPMLSGNTFDAVSSGASVLYDAFIEQTLD